MKIGALTHVAGICFGSVRKGVANFPLVHAHIALISVHAVRLRSGVSVCLSDRSKHTQL